MSAEEFKTIKGRQIRLLNELRQMNQELSELCAKLRSSLKEEILCSSIAAGVDGPCDCGWVKVLAVLDDYRSGNAQRSEWSYDSPSLTPMHFYCFTQEGPICGVKAPACWVSASMDTVTCAACLDHAD